MTGRFAMLRRLIRVAVITATFGLILIAVLLYALQDRMIYFPSPYPPGYRAGWPAGLLEIHFTTAQGRQSAFYLPPADGSKEPDRLWVAFGGNGSLTLDWLSLLSSLRDRSRTAFLLVDYPGYGHCEGKPSPASIQENAEAAFTEVCSQTGLASEALGRRTGILGLSLGCGVGLQFAASHPIDRVVLLAPFTSLSDMAQLRVGPLFKHLLRSNYDNRAGLARLAKRSPQPTVWIYHGTDDSVIPCSMGRSLAQEHPQMVRYEAVPGADHNNLVERVETPLRTLLNSDAPR
jgi:pimeloyl-ACP methyl ester carboxylesterase